MNNSIHMARRNWTLIWISLCIAVIHQAGATALLTVNPSVITNDYSGKLVLAVTGLTVGQRLVILKYLDANSNGIAEVEEVVPGGFTVADGRLPRIGGVRNINVPGDDDAVTNGQVRVELFYPGLDKVLDTAPGNYLIRISDTNMVQLDIQPFTVLPKTYPQGIRGRATSATSGLPLTNAFVILLMGPDGIGAGGVTADVDGHYTIYCPAGDYMLGALLPGFVTPFGVSMATVTAGQFVTNDLTAHPATLTVGGQLSDRASSNPIGGVMVQAESDMGLFAYTSTDSSGNYLLPLLPGEWEIGFSSESMATHGYVEGPGWVTNLSTSIAGLNFQAQRANALIYGDVRDDLGNPVPGVGLYANNMETDVPGTSLGTNADYAIGVLAGDWWTGPSSDDLGPLGYSGQSTNVTVGTNQAVRVDVALRRVTAHLAGRVVDDSGTAVSDLGISADNRQGGSSYVETDSNGNFDFGVFAGTWHLQLDYNQAQQRGFLFADLSITVADGESRTNIVYVARQPTGQVSGHVRNHTGDALANVGVWGSLDLGGTNYYQNVSTDDNGYYQFGVIHGVWTLGLQCEVVTSLGYLCSNSQSLTNTGGNQTLDFTVYPPVPLQVLTTNLPDGAVDAFYSQTLQATGGQQPYQWNVVNGALPTGLDLYPNGSLSGTPNAAGTNSFTVQVADWLGGTAVQTLTIAIPAAFVLQIHTTSLPNGTTGIYYSQQLDASGGQAPYDWTVTSGSLPSGLSLNHSDGTIAGFPDAAGTNTFTVQVMDANNSVASQDLIIGIAGAPGQWQDRAFMSTQRANPGIAVLNGKIYLLAGLTDAVSMTSTMEVYDPVIGSWQSCAPMPLEFINGAAPVVGAINGLLYTPGIFYDGAYRNLVMVYNPQSNTWTNLPGSTVSRDFGPCGGVISNKLYVAGGTADRFNSLEVYDPAAESWTVLTPMPTPRNGAISVVISNRLYVFGGLNSVSGGDSLTVEVYDPQADNWSSLPPMPASSSGRAAALCNSTIHFMGGGDSGGSTEVLLYDPANNSWSSGPPMPTKRRNLAAAAAGNSVFAIGGSIWPVAMPLSLPTVEQFSPPGTDRISVVAFKSDATTLAAGLGANLTQPIYNRLDAGGATNLTFAPAMITNTGAGINLDAVGGAMPGTQVITIPPGDGQNGFYKIPFVLPDGFIAAQLSLAANADYYARAFINGHPITSSMMSDVPQRIGAAQHTFCAAKDPDWIKPGTNELVIAVANYDGGGSGVMFYGFVTYQMVPTLQPPVWTRPGQIRIEVGSVTNETYTVQASTDLMTWTNILTTNASGGAFSFEDPNAAGRSRSYRVKVGP